MSAPEIKITAEVAQNPAVCKFTVDRLVHPGTISFTDQASAEGSPLAEKIMALDGVVSVVFAARTVTVTKADTGEWLPLAKQIGAAIRGQIQSGQPAFAEKYMPAPASVSAAELKVRIQQLIDDMINPNVASHGGFVELIDLQDHTVYVKMGGGCQGCGAASVTLKQGIEKIIKEEVPEIYEVLDVTDHAGGSNPFYAPAK